MAKKRPAWLSILPGHLPLSQYSLDELRSTKAAHAFLTEQVEGPPGIAEVVRGFRFLLFLRDRVHRRGQVPAPHPVLEGPGAPLHERPGVRRRRLRAELDPHGLS